MPQYSRLAGLLKLRGNVATCLLSLAVYLAELGFPVRGFLSLYPVGLSAFAIQVIIQFQCKSKSPRLHTRI